MLNCLLQNLNVKVYAPMLQNMIAFGYNKLKVVQDKWDHGYTSNPI